MRPRTQYARNKEGQSVAYQIFGEGPRDIVFIPDWVTNLEIMWEEPTLARFLDRMASFARVICFDKRGSGVSDPVSLGAVPTWEEWMDDVVTVLDAVGTDCAAVFGHGDGGQMALLFAATHPERAGKRCPGPASRRTPPSGVRARGRPAAARWPPCRHRRWS